MEQHDFLQGSPEWHQHRRAHFNASDAPAMLGISPYKTRTQLLDELETGIAPEVDDATHRRFADGHRFEALARPLAEKIIGRALYPVIGTEGKLSASFDGLTSDDEVCFEHKTLNDSIRSTMGGTGDASLLPAHYRAQMEQQLMVSGAVKCLFMATLWSGDELLEETHGWYVSDQNMRDALMQGWTQFAIDLEAHQPVIAKTDPKAEAIKALPSVFVQATGMVTASNLEEFKEAATEFIANIKTELVTDQDFADAEATVKFCKDAEGNLEATKASVLAQMSTVDEVVRTLDHIAAQLRDKRLMLDKLVKSEKELRKGAIVTTADKDFTAYAMQLEEEIKPIGLNRSSISSARQSFADAIKGKKKLDAMQEAVDTALRNAKFAADQEAADIRKKIAWCKEHASGKSSLFPDLQQIITKPMDDFMLLVKSRIEAEAKKREEERLRIEAEAKAKAEREAADKLAQEEERIRAEERAKAQAEERAKMEAEARAKAEAEKPAPVVTPVVASAPVQRTTTAEPDSGPSPAADHPAAGSPPIKSPSREALISCIALGFEVTAATAEQWLIAEFSTQSA